MYSLIRFVDNSRYSIEFLSNWSHPRNNNPPHCFLFSPPLITQNGRASLTPKERVPRKPLFPPSSLMEPRFFSLSLPLVETLPRDCRSVLLFAFRLSENNDLVFRGFCAPLLPWLTILHFLFSFQGSETGELGERPRDPPTTSVRLLRVGWPPSGRRFGRPSRSSSAPTSVHVPQAPFRRETMLVLW